MKGRGAGDIAFDEADFYAQGLIAGQHYLSAFIHGYDSYSFKRPNYPFTFIKAVSLTPRLQSLTDLLVEVKTSSTSGAGTDDDVYLRVNNRLRFKLDRAQVDDFERNQKAVYSLAVDTSTPFDASPAGYTLRDIQYLQLEKSKDGSSGAWKLGGVRLFVNGRLAYGNAAVEQWLRGDARTWRATDFRPPPDSAETIPVWLSLYDADSFLYGGDDHADLHPGLSPPQRRHHLPARDRRRADDRRRLGVLGQPLQLRRRSCRDPLPHRDVRERSAQPAASSAASASAASTAASTASAAAASSASTRTNPISSISDLGITTFTVAEPGSRPRPGRSACS